MTIRPQIESAPDERYEAARLAIECFARRDPDSLLATYCEHHLVLIKRVRPFNFGGHPPWSDWQVFLSLCGGDEDHDTSLFVKGDFTLIDHPRASPSERAPRTKG